jgi:DNA-binding NtrC family response regulator
MRKRILVVDDVPDWRDQLEEILSDYEVKTVDSYQAALEVIQKRDTELAIVDLRLNPADENDRQGMELLKELTKYRINAVVLTGYAEPTLQEEAEEKYYAFDFIDKSNVSRNYQILCDVVHNVFTKLEEIQKKKSKAIRDTVAQVSVPMTKKLSGYPLREQKE